LLTPLSYKNVTNNGLINNRHGVKVKVKGLPISLALFFDQSFD